MLSSQELAKIARDNRELAKALAPFQNRGNIPVVPPPSKLRRLWVFLGLVAPPPPPLLYTQDIVLIVNTLLTSGNVINEMAKVPQNGRSEATDQRM